MNNVDRYLNLVDVLKQLDLDSYESQTLTNVMGYMYNDLDEDERQQIEIVLNYD